LPVVTAPLISACRVSDSPHNPRPQRASSLCPRSRGGGRNWTLRGGDRVTETDGSTQQCELDPGEYFNPGPARISSQHRALLAYCRRFGVDLEIFVNENRNALFQDDSALHGKGVSSRRLHHDSAGHVAELLSKAINKHALDDELNALDREKLIYFLRKWGAALRPGRVNEPIELHTLLDSRFWHWQMFYEQRFHQQATMLQPVGGMDRTVSAFEAQIESQSTLAASSPRCVSEPTVCA